MLSRHLSGLKEAPRSLRDLLVPGLIVGVPFLLVLKQPDLGSALVFIGILFALLFWAGTRPLLLFLIASPGISLLLGFSTVAWILWMIALFGVLAWYRPYILDSVLVYLANVVMGAIAIPIWSRLHPYQQNRLLTFLNPEVDPQKAGYHAIQSKVAIGSGGWFGTGYTEGPQKRLAFLPEQHTDFVFSVVGEELGFVGVTVALALFLVMFFTLVRIARRASDPFSQPDGIRHSRIALHARLRERRHDGECDADHRYSAAILLLRWVVLPHLLRLPGHRFPRGRGVGSRVVSRFLTTT